MTRASSTTTTQADCHPRRHWLGWDQAALPAAARELIRMGRGEQGVCDLRQTLCILPGRRGGRQLLVELAQQCGQRAIPLIPPMVGTPGSMSLRLLETDTVIASVAERRLAWIRALVTCDETQLACLVAEPPGRDDLLAWSPLAALIEGVCDELSGEQMTPLDMVQHAEALQLKREADRWRAVYQLQQLQRKQLDAASVKDPSCLIDQALADGSVKHDVQLVLIGILDLNAQQRAIASGTHAPGRPTTVMIAAPKQEASSFDELGCVIPKRWIDRVIPIQDGQIVVADRPEDQADAVLQQLARLTGRPALDDITIALGQDTRAGSGSLAPAILRAGAKRSVRFHNAAGESLRTSGMYRLLHAIVEWLEQRTWASLATLLRHPDLEDWLRRTLRNAFDAETDHIVDRLLPDLDDWLATSLAIDAVVSTETAPAGSIQTVLELLGTTFASFEPSTAASRRLDDWLVQLLQLLETIYGGLESDLPAARRATIAAQAEAARDCWSIWIHAKAKLQPTCNGPMAIRLALEAASNVAVADDPHRDQIEMIGWLEVPLDPAPILIVTSVNDGAIPGSVCGDSFLPESLRRQAGLVDNARRCARDAAILEMTRNSRMRLTLIAGRRDADNEPLVPSRLLLATGDEALAQRVLSLTDETKTCQSKHRIGSATTSQFLMPQPTGPTPLDRISVTAFRLYLQCPYCFWLRYIQRLSAVENEPRELGPLGFGLLCHEVLQRFGGHEIAQSDDAQLIEQFLKRQLRSSATELLGDQWPAAVRVQLARLELRFAAFARWQAAHRRAGWRIVHAEYKLPEAARLQVPDQADVRVTGTIDRIDYNEKLNRWLIIDYKTSERAATPKQTHLHKRDGWIDLQLPLYWYLQTVSPPDAEVDVGYVNLPRRLEETGLEVADWGKTALIKAVETAQQSIIKIRGGVFPMQVSGTSHDHRDYPMICQVGVLGGASSAGVVS